MGKMGKRFSNQCRSGLGAAAVLGGGSAMQKKWKKKEASYLRFKKGGAVPNYYDKGGKLK